MFNLEYEQDSLNFLKKYQLLDSPTDEAFNKITQLATQLFNVPVAIISFFDEDRIWSKSIKEKDSNQQKSKEKELCISAIFSDEFHTIKKAIKNPVQLNDSSVRQKFDLQFYTSVPLKIKEKHNLGTLCIIDKKPRLITTQEQEILNNLAYLVSEQLEFRLNVREKFLAQEKALNVSSSIYESSNYAKIFIDSDLRIVYNNKKAKTICKTIFGKEPSKGDLSLDFILPQHQAEFKTLYKKVLEGQVIEVEKTDNQNWWKYRMRPVYDNDKNVIGIAHSVDDITQQQKIKEQTKQLQQNLDVLAQNFPDGSISLIDKNMIILYTGGQGYKIYDMQPSVFFGKHVSEMIIPNLYRKLQEVIPKIWRGISVSYEVEYKERIFLTKISPIEYENEAIESFVLTVIDITDRKNKEIKIQQQNDLLKEIAWQQSHEVRRPVATILGLLNLIKIEKKQEYIQLYLSYLQYEIELLDKTIKKIVSVTNEE